MGSRRDFLTPTEQRDMLPLRTTNSGSCDNPFTFPSSSRIPMTKSNKLFRYLVVSLFLLPLLNCAQRHDDKEKYYLVSANIQVPYWQAAGAGFMQAATQMKVKAWFVGPDKYDPQAQQQEFQKAVRAKATGILVSPADPAL